LNDCSIIPPEKVRITPAGYLLSLIGQDELVPYAEATPSEDRNYWRCRNFMGGRRCFFAPSFGS
jgi:hypothetical protein